MISKVLANHTNAYQFSIAPMMDCTDKHFRVLMRQISSKALLYSEMVVAKALHHSKYPNKFLDFNEIEHPIALQLGGDDPHLLAKATQLAEAWGYDEINLNVGCPSPKVSSGNFGACLMGQPEKVTRCIEAMSNATSLPITIKHRLGIDNLDTDELLTTFVDQISKAGAKRFIIHARKAWLKGLDPKQNRTIPPLQYERVIKLKNNRPNLIIELNGGLDTPEKCLEALKTCDGAMVGRAAYSHPLRWQTIDEQIFGESPKSIKASDVLIGMLPYINDHLQKGGRLWNISKHLLQLVEGVPGARLWRKELSSLSQKQDANIRIIENAAKKLQKAEL